MGDDFQIWILQFSWCDSNGSVDGSPCSVGSGWTIPKYGHY